MSLLIGHGPDSAEGHLTHWGSLGGEGWCRLNEFGCTGFIVSSIRTAGHHFLGQLLLGRLSLDGAT